MSTTGVRAATAASVTLTGLLLAGCAPSAGSLEEAVAGRPGVVDVSVSEGDGGDDDIPFASPAKRVDVTMAGDASAEEVLAVFDAYDDAIDDGDVGAVEVRLVGVRAALASGEGVHATPEAVADLVTAAQLYVSYRREAYPTLPSVEIRLLPGDFATVLATADRYPDLGTRAPGGDEQDGTGVDEVQVTSGTFLLIRDAVNEDLAVTSARERLVTRVERLFDLTGAVVSGRGPLRIHVPEGQRAAVEDLVDRNPEAALVGRVVVG
jgi:hypothetical protein